jgi:hypothetical protein
MFLQLSAVQFLPLLLQENAKSFVTLKLVYHMINILWGSVELAHKSPSNLNSWVQARVWSCGICGGQSGAGAGFLQVLWFPLPIFIPPIAPQSPSSII